MYVKYKSDYKGKGIVSRMSSDMRSVPGQKHASEIKLEFADYLSLRNFSDTLNKNTERQTG